MPLVSCASREGRCNCATTGKFPSATLGTRGILENHITVEANLTSNVHTSTVPDLASHPLRAMLARGLIASINTDDPGVSAIDLPHEFNIAAPAAGLSREQIRQAQINALETAFLSAEEKAALRTKRGIPKA